MSSDAIVIPVDYASQVTGELVSAAATFVVDDQVAWADNRVRGRLPGWPDPVDTLGGLMARRQAGTWLRPPGVVLALHQGPGLADLLFADAVLRSVIAAGD